MAAEFFEPSEDELARTVFQRDPGMYAQQVIRMENAVYNGETEEECARRIFRQNLPMAASRIVKIAAESPNDRTALDASKYITERVLGKVGDDLAFASENALSAFAQGIEDQLRKETEG